MLLFSSDVNLPTTYREDIVTDLNALLAKLNKLLIDVDTKLSEFTDSNPSIDDVGATLIELHSLKAAFGDVYSTYSARATKLFQDAQVEDMAYGENRIEVRTASDRKQWEHPRLIAEVARRLVSESIDMDTGEVMTSPEELIAKVLDFVQPSYWRIKELSKIGINADKFCEVGEYKTNIIVRKAK